MKGALYLLDWNQLAIVQIKTEIIHWDFEKLENITKDCLIPYVLLLITWSLPWLSIQPVSKSMSLLRQTWPLELLEWSPYCYKFVSVCFGHTILWAQAGLELILLPSPPQCCDNSVCHHPACMPSLVSTLYLDLYVFKFSYSTVVNLLQTRQN